MNFEMVNISELTEALNVVKDFCAQQDDCDNCPLVVFQEQKNGQEKYMGCRVNIDNLAPPCDWKINLKINL